MSLITNNDFSCWDLNETIVFQNFSETYSLTLRLLQKNPHCLSWERNPKDTVIFVFMFDIKMQKTIHFLQHFRAAKYCAASDTILDEKMHKRKTKVLHWEMERTHAGLHLAGKCRDIITVWRYCVLPDATSVLITKELQDTPKLARKKDRLLLPCPIQTFFLFFFFNIHFIFFFFFT